MTNISPEKVKQLFDPIYKAEANSWAGFAAIITERHFGKNEAIKEYDTTEKYLNILIQGSAGLFIYNGKSEICINLFYENDFFNDYLSFLKQEKKPLKTMALEDIIVWSVSYADMQALYQRSAVSIHIARMIAEKLYAKKQEEQINLLTLTPQQRYVKLLTERPEILQRTSLKYIAPYLGITAESLSRLRKRPVL